MSVSLDTHFMRIQKFVFSLMGFDIFTETSANDRKWLTLSFIGSLAIFHVPMALGIFVNRQNMSLLTEALTALPTSMITIYKYIFFVYCRKDLVQLIQHIRRILIEEAMSNDLHGQYALVANRQDQQRSKVYAYSYLSAVVFVGIKSLAVMLSAHLNGEEVPFILPFVAVYPWDTEQLPWYVFTFVWNLICSFTAVAMTTSFDVLLFAFINNVCALFRIAQNKMRCFAKQVHGSVSAEQRLLIEIVLFHEECLRIAARLSHFFQWVVFFQFFINSIQLCMVGVQVSYTFLQPECIYFIIFECSLLMEIFMFSKCGEELKSESFKCAVALYDSDWYELHPSTRRLLIIVMRRAQAPCSLSGFIVEANMETFKAILQTSMSYIMMLHKLG